MRVEGRSKIIASVLPASGRSAVAALGLHGAGVVDHPAQIRGRNVDEIEEVPDRAHPRASSLTRSPPVTAGGGGCTVKPRAGAVEARDRLGDFLLADDERRQQPHDVVAGGDGDHLLGAQRVDQLAGRHHGAQADQQSFAAHLGDHRRIAILDLREPLLEQQRDPLHAFEKAGRQHHVEHGVGDAHRQRIAAEGRAVRAGGHALGRLGRRQAGADRETAAERLGQRHDVGRDAGALVGEQVAGAAHAGLHLVEDQQQAVLVAKFAQRPQERRLDHAHAALAHDRLDQRSPRSRRRSRALVASRSANGT